MTRAPSGPVVDPDWALFHLQRSLWDPVEHARLGSLSPELHYCVNGEVYRFASPRTLRRFVAAPARWCGAVRDPVTGCKFVPTERSPEVFWVNGPYFFESDSTKARFIDDPHQFEVLRGL